MLVGEWLHKLGFGASGESCIKEGPLGALILFAATAILEKSTAFSVGSLKGIKSTASGSGSSGAGSAGPTHQSVRGTSFGYCHSPFSPELSRAVRAYAEVHGVAIPDRVALKHLRQRERVQQQGTDIDSSVTNFQECALPFALHLQQHARCLLAAAAANAYWMPPPATGKGSFAQPPRLESAVVEGQSPLPAALSSASGACGTATPFVIAVQPGDSAPLDVSAAVLELNFNIADAMRACSQPLSMQPVLTFCDTIMDLTKDGLVQRGNASYYITRV
jgi:hypothetical protein